MLARLRQPRSQVDLEPAQAPGPGRSRLPIPPSRNRRRQSRPTTVSRSSSIDPNSTADLFGFKAGDVLLEYNGIPLEIRSPT